MSCFLTHIASYIVSCVRASEMNEQKRGNKCNVKIHEISSLSKSKAVTLSHTNEVAINDTLLCKQNRQNIPTKMQFVDPYRQGKIIAEGEGMGYRQIFVIRSYEIDQDKVVTIESIFNLLQETAMNHVWMSGLFGDGFGTTHGMKKYNLIWVVTRMQLQVDYYPIWGEVIEIDTWIGASGKNSTWRDWIVRSHTSGVVYAYATSTWVMMNKKTRRVSKIPDEVRGEISPWFIEKQEIKEDTSEKIEKIEHKAKYAISDLKTARSDLDMNHHVNNVKYVRWMLEAIPGEIQKSHQLSSIVVEYKRECRSLDIVESLCDPFEPETQQDETINEKTIEDCKRVSFDFNILDGRNSIGCFNQRQYTHLLKLKGEKKNEEVVRGRTIWKSANQTTTMTNLENNIVACSEIQQESPNIDVQSQPKEGKIGK